MTVYERKTDNAT